MAVQIGLESHRQRTLRFTLGAMRDMEREMDGTPLSVIVHRIAQGGADAITIAMWAALKHEDGTLTVKKTERLLERFFDHGHQVGELSKALNDALLESGFLKNEKPDVDEETEGNVPATPTAGDG
jgi:hypothetical protein